MNNRTGRATDNVDDSGEQPPAKELGPQAGGSPIKSEIRDISRVVAGTAGEMSRKLEEKGLARAQIDRWIGQLNQAIAGLSALRAKYLTPKS